MKLSSGVDIVEIERVRDTIERYGRRFLDRVFTAYELDEAGKNPASLAARFAAKEAVAKALGCGIGIVAWQEIEVRRGHARQPELYLYGAAERLSLELGLTTWSISLSHSQSAAVAFVVALGD